MNISELPPNNTIYFQTEKKDFVLDLQSINYGKVGFAKHTASNCTDLIF